ncbi:MAG: 3-phosphoserine/phosphohydroxythreonine transaminase [Pseudomonadota bacterium]
MSRVYNFSAGPAALPESVLSRIESELLDYHDSGMSVMEMSHRGPVFSEIAGNAEQTLRRILSISDDYAVLFLQGGATLQFSAIPLNLCGSTGTADYLNTGSWSKKAIKEASKFCNVNVVASGESSNFTTVPKPDSWRLSSDPAYFHFTLNETIAGVEFLEIPEVDNCPLVTDASSTLLSRPLDVSRFGLVYAGAQKNIGPAGLTLVIVRRDLLEKSSQSMPTLLSYQVMAETGSMSNTPPTFAWYVAGLVFEWIENQGGLEVMGELNRAKAAALYSAIDSSDFYSNPVDPAYRSWMNVPFVLAGPDLDGLFLDQAAERGLTNLKGHRSVGGMRASIYNAMPRSGVDALIEFMADFEREHG